MTSRFQSLRLILSHDRSQLRHVAGLRSTVAVVLVLAAGVYAGHPLAGLAGAIGAQVAGFAALSGTVRKRVRTTVFAAFWMAITTLIGGLTGTSVFAVPVVGAIGFVAGLLVCLSNEAGLIGMWAVIALLFMSNTPASPQQALLRALFVLAGALMQTTLVVLMEWLSRTNAERDGVSAAFRAVAAYAENPSRAADLGVAAALLEADARLRDSFLVQSRWEQLRALCDLAESTRIEMIALVGIQHSLAGGTGESSRAGDTQEPSRATAAESGAGAMTPEVFELVQRLVAARRVSAEILIALADSLDSSDTRRAQAAAATAQARIDHLQTLSRRAVGSTDSAGSAPAPQTAPDGDGAWQHVDACIRHTHLELAHGVALIAAQPHGLAQRLTEQRIRLTAPPVRSAWETIRTHLTFRSATFRHAVRLAVALCIAAALGHISPLPRGYWLPLTVVVILKPEFTTTFTRGIGRTLGTLIGALLATLIVTIPDETHAVSLLVLGLFLWGMYTFLTYNLVLFSCLLTAEIVVLLSFFVHLPPGATIVERVVYTAAGSLLALVTYLVWPTWQHRNVPGAVVRLLTNEQRYLAAVLKTPGASTDVVTARKQTRLARTNAVNLVDQASAEPVSGALDSEAVHGLLTALHRMSDALLSLESYLANTTDAVREHPDVRQFAAYVDRCLAEIAIDVETPPPDDQRAAAAVLDSVRTFTKQQIRQFDLPIALTAVLLRVEDNIGTMFRMLPLTHAPRAQRLV